MIKALFIFLLYPFYVVQAQDEHPSFFKNGIDKPPLTTAHHFGMFQLRINQNFKEKPVQNSSFQFSIASANTFHPQVEGYLPNDPLERERLSKLVWYNRHFNFIDQQTTPADYLNIHIDAVFKVFRFQFQTRLSDRQELGISVRSFVPTKGNYPLSFFTNDDSLEWFHSNIAGGDDPFGRRYFGLNQMTFSYLDQNHKSINLNNNQFVFAGIEFHHFYYPKIFKPYKNIFVNAGIHFGINTTPYYPNLDLGVSANMTKKWCVNNNNEFRFGFGISGLRKKAISYGSSVDIGNNLWMASGEANIEFTHYTPIGNYHSFSINYQLQTRYNKIREKEYFVLKGYWKEIHSGWHNGITTLYDTLSVWSFLYTYAKKNVKLTLYIQEDLKLNNAPDLQTGFSIKIPILFLQ